MVCHIVMAGTFYDNLIGGRSGSISYSATATEFDYPPADVYNVISTLHVPRVYGKDLSAFEIASSGKISVTLSDLYSFDLERGLNSNVILKTVAQDSFTIAADDGQYSFTLDPSSNLVGLTSDGYMDMHANSNMQLSSSSNMIIDVSDSLLVTSGSNMTFSSQKIDFITNTFGIDGDNIGIVAQSNVLINAQTESITIFAACNLFAGIGIDANLNIGNSLVMEVGSNVDIYAPLTTINGNFDISGVINGTTDAGLLVQDKVINLAFTSNLGSNLVDGVDNDGAGILVQGVPSGVDADSSQAALYEKSFKWNYNGGMDHLGTPNVENESYWDLKGGAFRITHNKQNGDDVAFSFRVNEFDELELVKKQKSNTGYEYKRIAKFGRTLL